MSRRDRSSTPRSARNLRADYARATGAIVLAAAGALARGRPGGISKRRLVNFLRGNRFLEPGEEAARACGAYGALEGHRGDWVGELVERLVDLGYLGLEPAGGGRSPGLVLTADGARAGRGDGGIPVEVLPRRSALGEHPAVEDRLRALRKEIARAEGRSAYAIFPNSALAAIAERRPADLAELAEIPGFGESRIRKYGRRILATLRSGRPG
ncbi:MAG: HRDC domain-containing protein [Planctomycetota bacterium]